MNTAAAAAETVATAVLMVVVSVDNVYVATAGVAAVLFFADTADAAVNDLFAPSLKHHINTLILQLQFCLLKANVL